MKAGTKVRVVSHHHTHPDRIGVVSYHWVRSVYGKSPESTVIVKFDNNKSELFLREELEEAQTTSAA